MRERSDREAANGRAATCIPAVQACRRAGRAREGEAGLGRDSCVPAGLSGWADRSVRPWEKAASGRATYVRESVDDVQRCATLIILLGRPGARLGLLYFGYHGKL